MLKHMNIQAIAKWFKAGCDNAVETTSPPSSSSSSTTTRTTAGDNIPQDATSSLAYNNNNTNSTSLDQFHILQINDIGLLSKLSDIKSKTLEEKVHRRLAQIGDTQTKKTFLVAVCNEFLFDGRKSLVLALLNYQFDQQTQLSVVGKQELLLQRTLCYFKMAKPKEAFTDLYQVVQQQQQQQQLSQSSAASTIEQVHVQILEEIKKYLNSSKAKSSEDEMITIDGQENSVLTYHQILRLYEQQLAAMIKPGQGITTTMTNERSKQRKTFQFGANIARVKTGTSKPGEMMDTAAQMDHQSGGRGETMAKKVETSLNQEITLCYTNKEGEVIEVEQDCATEWLVDNIFQLKTLLVSNIVGNDLAAIGQLFQTFGALVELKPYKDKYIIEYDNVESPRRAVTCLSGLHLPGINEPHTPLAFRFIKGRDQKHLRICKQNQIKLSQECYFWRTTGCNKNNKCHFKHHPLAKGIDLQEWMRGNNANNDNNHNNQADNA